MFLQYSGKDWEASEIMQQVKTLVCKPGYLSLIRGSYIVEPNN